MSNLVQLTPQYFPLPTIGRPVPVGSKIFVGIPDIDPTVPANQLQVSVLQEDTTLVPVAQPILTGAGGVPLYNGSPVSLFVTGDYSLTVNDPTDVQIYYVPRTTADAAAVFFPVWDAGTTYAQNAYVTGSDNRLYYSIAGANLNNDPTSTSGFWISYVQNGDTFIGDTEGEHTGAVNGNPADDATNLQSGFIRIATDVEADEGTDELIAINPKQLEATVLEANPFIAKAGAVIDATERADGTYTRVGTLITVTATNIGVRTGYMVDLNFTTGTATSGSYIATEIDNSNFTVEDTVSGATSGDVTINLILKYALNIASIADLGVGRFKLIFITRFTSAFYAMGSSTSRPVAQFNTNAGGIGYDTNPQAFECEIVTTDGSVTVEDHPYSSMIFFGELEVDPLPKIGTYSRAGNTVTSIIADHGVNTGFTVELDFTTGTATSGSYTATVLDANTFTTQDPASGATSGDVTLISITP